MAVLPNQIPPLKRSMTPIKEGAVIASSHVPDSIVVHDRGLLAIAAFKLVEVSFLLLRRHGCAPLCGIKIMGDEALKFAHILHQ